ncbi:hypothetical protein JCM10212_000053 [Sporobolomyces blumeae]
MPALAEYLEIAQVLSDPIRFDQVASDVSLAALEVVLPHLTLPTLLRLSNEFDHVFRLLASSSSSSSSWDTYLVQVFSIKRGGDANASDKSNPVAGAWAGLGGKEVMQTPIEGIEVFIEAGKDEGGNGSKPPAIVDEFRQRFNAMSGGSYFDLFLYGLDPDELVPKVKAIIDHFKAKFPTQKLDAAETDDAANAAAAMVHPRRPIQIILHSNRSIFDALASFDLDACACAYTGNQVVANPRAVRALALGGWTGGVNFLDPKLTKPRDPSTATCASRALKYATRGFAFAVPPAAIAHLDQQETSFAVKLAQEKTNVEKKSYRLEHKTHAVNGLDAFLRRAWNQAHGVDNGEGPDQFDYGPMRNPVSKHLEPEDLESTENGQLKFDWFEHNIALFNSFVDFLSQDSSVLPSKKIDETNLASFVIPNVASFDSDYILGYKKFGEVDDPSKQSWSMTQNVQYIIRAPDAVLPVIEAAGKAMRDLVASLSSDDKPSLEKKASLDAVSKGKPTFTKTQTELIHEVHHKVGPKVDEVNKLVRAVKEALRPKRTVELESLSGKEFGKTRKDVDYAYLVVVFASLFEFRGVSREVDRARDLVYRLYTALARAATRLPLKVPLMLVSSDWNDRDAFKVTPSKILNALENGPEGNQKSLLKYLGQESKEDVVARFEEVDAVVRALRDEGDASSDKDDADGVRSTRWVIG